ncbi:EamA family transporter [Candidatus Bathyarchaeota archaeon]|nr:EamA family transporter [Candidatus Bathyarchaeota archaeon]
MSFTRSHALLILVCFCFSFILVLSTLLKNTGLSSLQQAFSRITLALPLIFVLIRGRFKLKKDDMRYFALSGSVFSCFLLSGLSSIAFGCPIAVATALIYTQPFFTAILATISEKEKMTSRKIMAVAMGVVGVFLVSGVATEPLSSLNISGLGFALLGGFFYSAYLYVKRMMKADYTPLQGLFNTFIFAAPSMLLLGTILSLFTKNTGLIGFTVPNSYQLTLLILFASFSTALPYGLLNYVKPSEVPPTTEGTILLLDPLLHNLWAVLILQQYISPIRYVGVGLILLSAAVIFKTKN